MWALKAAVITIIGTNEVRVTKRVDVSARDWAHTGLTRAFRSRHYA